MPVYIIVQIFILDRETYKKYEEGFMDIFLPYGGEILVVEENPDVLEGKWDFTRTVVIKFNDENTAREWYDSPAYQDLMQYRSLAADSNLIMAKGFNPAG